VEGRRRAAALDLARPPRREEDGMIAGRRVAMEPDLRYWRRRANRRVRKARWTRNLRAWVQAGAICTALGAALVQATLRHVERLLASSEFAVAHIEIEGVRRADRAALGRRLDAYLGRNIAELDLGAVAAAARAEPWVLEATAKRIIPDTVRVTVGERRPSAVALIDGVPHLVDALGFVVGRSGPALADDLPVLTGIDGLDQPALAAALRRGVAAVERLRRHAAPWLREVSELDLSRPDRVALRTVEPGPTLLLDPERVERNLERYRELRPEIVELVGSLDYVDLRWRDRITVRPATEVPRMEGG
jgi:cell division septal protein FtsQ